jgi:hypothetical protein
LPAVGLNGTVAVLPQSVHFISVELFSDILCFLLIEAEKMAA